MTLTLNLSQEMEKRLRERAAGVGIAATDYALQIITTALQTPRERYETTPEEQERLQKAFDEMLQRAEELEPDPNRPRLRGQEAEIEEIIAEKHRKQGLKL